jgi:hypothetical protein
MDPAAFVCLGRIVKTHGLAGEVSVAVTDGLPLERLVGVPVWFVPPPGSIRRSAIRAQGTAREARGGRGARRSRLAARNEHHGRHRGCSRGTHP